MDQGVDDEAKEIVPGEDEPMMRTRAGRSIVRPSRYAQLMKVSRDEWKMRASDEAIKMELQMLFDELKALQ